MSIIILIADILLNCDEQCLLFQNFGHNIIFLSNKNTSELSQSKPLKIDMT